MTGRTRLLIATGVTALGLAVAIPAVALATDGDDHPGGGAPPIPHDKLCALTDEQLEQKIADAEKWLREPDAFSDDWLQRRADDARARGHERIADRLERVADRDRPRVEHRLERRKELLTGKLENGTFGDGLRAEHDECGSSPVG